MAGRQWWSYGPQLPFLNPYIGPTWATNYAGTFSLTVCVHTYIYIHLHSCIFIKISINLYTCLYLLFDLLHSYMPQYIYICFLTFMYISKPFFIFLYKSVHFLKFLYIFIYLWMSLYLYSFYNFLYIVVPFFIFCKFSVYFGVFLYISLTIHPFSKLLFHSHLFLHISTHFRFF